MEPASLESKINQLEAKYKQRINWPYITQDEIKVTSNPRPRSPWASSHSFALAEGVSTPQKSPCMPAFASVDATFIPAPPNNDAAMKRMSSSWAFAPGAVPLVPVTSPSSIMSMSLTTCENFNRFDDEFNQLPQRTSSTVSGPIPIAQSDKGYMSQQDLAQAMQSWTTFSTSPTSTSRHIISPAHSSRGKAEIGNLGANHSNMNGISQNSKDSFSCNPWNIQWNMSNNSSPKRQSSQPNESPFKENQESLSPYTPSPNSAGSNRIESRTSSQSTPSPGGAARMEFKLSSGCPSPIGLRRVELGKSVTSNSSKTSWSGIGSLTNSPVSNLDIEIKPRIDTLCQNSSETCSMLDDCGGLGSESHSISDGFGSGNHGCIMANNDDIQNIHSESMELCGMPAGAKSNETPGTPSQGSARPSLTIGGLSLSGQPRRRQALNLACVPQKVPDRSEMDVKYQDVIKNSGFLTLDGHRVPTDIKDLVQLGDLGKGTCGHVVKMMHQKSGQVMAVKQMHRSGSFEDNKRILMDLDVVLKCDSCPYIVRSIGTFITPSEVWICMELMATCLDKLSKRISKPIPEPILGKITVATVNALHYLKEKHGVIHRDIKPSNILLDERGRIKLCDFGISGRLVDSKAKTRSAGCTAYMSPERIDPPDPMKPDYDIRADVWSLGLSLVEMAIGEFPYKDCKTDFEVLTKVLQSEPPCLPSGSGFSIEFTSFVQQCLTKNYQNRPKYQQLLDHSFVLWYTTASVDVAAWFAMVQREIESKEVLNSQSEG